MHQNSAFTFNVATGIVHGPSDKPHTVGKRETASWTVCEHLRAVLDAQLKQGARIEYVTGQGSWSLIDLDVSLDRVDSGALSNVSLALPNLAAWTNTDSHYPLQSGLSCAACRQTLSWPTTTTRLQSE